MPHGNYIVEISLHFTFEFNCDSHYFYYQKTKKLNKLCSTSTIYNDTPAKFQKHSLSVLLY